VHWVHGEAKISASFVGELGKVVSCFILHDGMGRTAAFFFSVQDSTSLVWLVRSNNSYSSNNVPAIDGSDPCMG